jgi:hypothetical protein
MITWKNHARNEIKDLRWNAIDARNAGRSWRSLGACICAARTRASKAPSIAVV